MVTIDKGFKIKIFFLIKEAYTGKKCKQGTNVKMRNNIFSLSSGGKEDDLKQNVECSLVVISL